MAMGGQGEPMALSEAYFTKVSIIRAPIMPRVARCGRYRQNGTPPPLEREQINGVLVIL